MAAQQYLKLSSFSEKRAKRVLNTISTEKPENNLRELINN